jgi:O-antigen ligase
MAATLLSLALSPDPRAGIAPINKFSLFLMGLLTVNFISTPERAKLTYRVLLVTAAVGSTYAIVQFAGAYRIYRVTHALADDPTVAARARGFMAHWMTFSGGQTLVWCAAIPTIVVLGRRWFLPTLLVGTGILVSFTRSAWIGSAAGVLSIVGTIPRRWLLSALAPMGLIALFAAGPIQHRLAMSMEPNFTPDTGRLALLDAGLRMVRDHPLFGVGPGRIYDEFPRYHQGPLEHIFYGHLENNVLQIAAERGLICLAAFLWFFADLYVRLARLLKSGAEMVRTSALAALAATTGFLVSGLFSFNFGNSVVLLTFLFIVSIPFGLTLRKD